MNSTPGYDFADKLDKLYSTYLLEWSDIQDQLKILKAVSDCQRSTKILELGVRTGVSTCAFLYGTLLSAGTVESVDINPFEGPEWFHEIPWWTFTRCSDLDYIPLHPTNSYDVLFIDTSHYYNHTMEELRKFVPYVKSGGVVLCHDTKVETIGQYNGNYPVARALTDFCSETHPHWSWEECGGTFGLGILNIP